MVEILISESLELFLSWKYIGVFLGSLGLFPIEIVILILASTHQGNIFLISIVSGFGGLIGSYLTYFLGYVFTEENLYNWLEGNGKFLRVDIKRYKKSKERIKKRSLTYLFLTRFIPWLKIVASIASGFLRINFFSYSIVVFLGGFIYAILLGYIGSKIDYDIESIKKFMGLFDRWVIYITLGYILISVIYKRKRKILKFIKTLTKPQL